MSAQTHPVIAALEAGAIVLDDGSKQCRVCDRIFERPASYGPHWRRAHFAKLPKSVQLTHSDADECDICGLVVTNMHNHLRDRHHVSKHSKRVRKSKPEPSTEIAVVEHDEHTHDDEHELRAVTTPTDAGLAILAGLRPGTTLRVEELPDVVEWLAQTERVVGLLKR